MSILADDDTRGPARLAEAGVLGLTLLGLGGFGLGMLLGTGVPAVGAAGAVIALPALALAGSATGRARFAAWWRSEREALPHPGPRSVAAALGVALACTAVAFVMARTVTEREGVLGSGVAHNLGDLPFHVGIVQSFALGANVPPEHPELAGHALTYPFLVDLVAAQLVMAGGDLARVLDAQSVGLALLLLFVLHRWARDLTGDGLAAVLAPALVLLSGGLGFLELAGELRELGAGWLTHLARLPHDYTIRHEGGLRFGNVVTVLLVPQRALLLGLPLALMAWRRWWLALDAGDPERARRVMLHAGVLVGLLPLAHSHSFAVMMAAALALALLFRHPAWWRFFAAALALGMPQVLWLASRSSLTMRRFVSWQPGWESGDEAIVSFWLQNAGLFLPLLLVALAWRGATPVVSGRRLLFWLPFAGCFVVPNLLRLSPWIWDNIKYLVFWLVASAPLVALLLARLARRGLAGPLAASVLTLTLTLSGALDLWRVASGAAEVRVFTPEGRAFARLVAERTPPGARVLTAPAYDHPVLLSGRRQFLGYEGHIWSQGLDAGDRRASLLRIYAGEADAVSLARALGLDYVVWGPHEARAFRSSPFVSRLELVAAEGPYRLHRLPGGAR